MAPDLPHPPRSASVSTTREQAVPMAPKSAQWAPGTPQGLLHLATVGQELTVSSETRFLNGGRPAVTGSLQSLLELARGWGALLPLPSPRLRGGRDWGWGRQRGLVFEWTPQAAARAAGARPWCRSLEKVQGQ
jgi:hypothetical protein